MFASEFDWILPKKQFSIWRKYENSAVLWKIAYKKCSIDSYCLTLILFCNNAFEAIFSQN